MSAECMVKGCEKPVVAKGICDMHRARLRRTGRLDRDPVRTSHPLYTVWCSRKTKGHFCEGWKKDFWKFVSDVGERPEGEFQLRARDDAQPLGPDNFFWLECFKGRSSSKEYFREWRNKNRRKVRETHWLKRYNITAEDYESMVEAQSGECAICSKSGEHLHVDHDHGTGKVRGLLCGPCNQGLGNFQDKEQVMRAGIEYLNKHQGV